MADKVLTPAQGTYQKDATDTYWGAGDRVVIKGGTSVEIWEEGNATAYQIKFIGKSGGVELERLIGATGSYYTSLGRDAELTIDIKRQAAGANISIAFLVN